MNKFTLTIDIGNSNTKCCLFGSHGDLLTTFSYEKLNDIIDSYQIKSENIKVISCSVVDKALDHPYRSETAKSFFVNSKFKDMPVHYNETVGIDRLAAAYSFYHKNNFAGLIIDTGTFTTVDHVDIKGFNGGFILPGLNLISEAYNKGFQLHKPVNYEEISLEKLSSTLPQTTAKAIENGALLSFLAPISEILRQNATSNIVITGGNGEFLYNFLKNSHLCQDASIQFEPHLVHIGLFHLINKE